MEKQVKRKIIIAMTACTVWVFILGFLSVTSLFAEDTIAQNTEEFVITVDYQDIILTDALNDIEGKTEFNFLYDKAQLDTATKHVTIHKETATVQQILLNISKQTGVRFRQTGNNIAVYCPPEEKPESAQTGVIKGTVTNAETGEPMP